MGTHTTSLHDDITDVPGVRVGHASDTDAKTGVTVVVFPNEGCPAGIHRGGNASSTRQCDSLEPRHLVDRIHAVCFTGGSGFGLDAAGGVMRRLEAQGIGIPIVDTAIPIVPTATVFDLNFGNGSVRPTSEMGAQACASADTGPIEHGSVGAGTGATVGKIFGIDNAMKGGVGSASIISGDLIVGALVVANPFGDVTDREGNILVGARKSPDSLERADTALLLEQGIARSRTYSEENTTLAVVAANAKLSKVAAGRIAVQATLAMGRVIQPFHTNIDGDITIVAGAGELDVDPNRIALLAGTVLQRAIIKAVKNADGFGVIPAWSDLAELVQERS